MNIVMSGTYLIRADSFGFVNDARDPSTEVIPELIAEMICGHRGEKSYCGLHTTIKRGALQN